MNEQYKIDIMLLIGLGLVTLLLVLAKWALKGGA